MGRAGGQRGHRNDSIDHSRSPKQCHPAHSSRRMCVSLCLLHSRRLSYWHTLWLSPFVCLTFFSVCIHTCAFQTDASVMALAKCQLFHTVPLALRRLAVDCYWLPMASIHWLFSEKHTHTHRHTRVHAERIVHKKKSGECESRCRLECLRSLDLLVFFGLGLWFIHLTLKAKWMKHKLNILLMLFQKYSRVILSIGCYFREIEEKNILVVWLAVKQACVRCVWLLALTGTWGHRACRWLSFGF